MSLNSDSVQEDYVNTFGSWKDRREIESYQIIKYEQRDYLVYNTEKLW